MKQTFLIAVLLIINLCGISQILKSYKGPYTVDNKDGEVTYTYFEQNGDRVFDGNFSFICINECIHPTNPIFHS